MIKFQKVRWKNFLSTGNYWIEINLEEAQNTLILGKNGSGKSTLLDALCFGLFGTPFRKINKPTITNSINKKNCVVELEFKIDSKQYKIIRGLAPAIFEIYEDNLLKKMDTSVEDYQEDFEKFHLKFNKKSFTQIVILGSASFVPFMELSAADRRAIIEDLLDIQIFSTMAEIVKKRLKSNKEETEKNKIRLESAQQKKGMQEAHINKLQQNKQELINKTEQENKEYRETIQSLTEKNTLLEHSLSREERAKLAHKSKIEKSIKDLTKMEAKLEQTIQKHKDHSSFFESSNTCPTCTQDIDDVFKQAKLTVLSEKTEKCNDGLKQLQEQLTEKQGYLNEIKHLEEVARTVEIQKVTIATQISELNRLITQNLLNIESWSRPQEGTEHEEAQLQLIIKEIENTEIKQKTLLEEKQYLEYANKMLQDSGIKSRIIKQYIPIINTVLNKHLAQFDFFVNFTLDESFKETIKSRYRDDFVYHSFSQGQKMRISMALMLTWRTVAKLKNSIDTNLLILDEIFDSSLDGEGADELMKILHSLKENNVFVISHRGDILRDKFSHTIKFVEKQNFSYIE